MFQRWHKFFERDSHTYAATAVVIVVAAMILLLMGRTPFGPTGEPGFWTGVPQGLFTSQRLLDVYTFTHITHGLAFYLLLWLIFPNIPLGARLVLAVGIESAWEIFENTDFIIQRYRELAIARGYYGDSVLNVVGDILAAALGFVFAAKLPTRLVVGIFILLEIILALLIRDNLILNIIMLIYPVPAIQNWQSGG